jgi:hypothetical protein
VAKTVRRTLTFTSFYDEMISERMKSRGISRSEAARQLLDRDVANGKLAAIQVRGQVQAIESTINSLARKSLPIRDELRVLLDAARTITRIVEH